jgi:ABC-type multidrug transport system fused ATPase/permease subunit
MRKILYGLFLSVFSPLCLVAQDSSENAFGSPAPADESLPLYFIIAAVVLLAIFALRSSFGSAAQGVIEHSQSMSERRQGKIREARERKQQKREAIAAARAAAEEKRRAELEAMLAAQEEKRRKDAEKNARRNAIKALDELSPDEEILKEMASDDFLTKVISGKHMIERLRRDVGMPAHTEDSDMVTAGKMYKYGDGKHVFVQLTDVNAAKIEAKILSDYRKAKQKKEEAEARAFRNKLILIFGILFLFVFLMVFFSLA